MSTKVEKSILVNVPLSIAYNQWTQFEEFPQFMSGIKSVTQLDDERLEWVAEIAGVRRQWTARILEQVPDKKVSWAATEGATNAGSVTFEDVGGGQTQVHLVLEYEPEGLVEKIGDKLNVVENQAEGDLDRFKAFIESEGLCHGGVARNGRNRHRCRRARDRGRRRFTWRQRQGGNLGQGRRRRRSRRCRRGGRCRRRQEGHEDTTDGDADVTVTPAATTVPPLPETDPTLVAAERARSGATAEEDALRNKDRSTGGAP